MTGVIEVITTLFSLFGQYPFLASKEKLMLSREEYVLIQMLCFCSAKPRTDAEVRSHCSIGKTEFLGLWRHCASRGLLKLVFSEGVPCLVITERGRNVLQATKKIIKALARNY